MGLEALAAVSDVKASGAGMEADWNLETGRDWGHGHGGRHRRTYDVTVYDKSEHQPELIIAFVEILI